MKHLTPFKLAVMATLSLLAFGAAAFGHVEALFIAPAVAADWETLNKALDGIENRLTAMSTKAEGEFTTLGKVSTDTKTALDNLGTQQREMADRLLQLEQKGHRPGPTGDDAGESWGAQVIKSKGYEAFAGGHAQKMRLEVKNTLVGADANVAPDRKPGVVGGAFQPLTLEQLIPGMPTSSNAIEFTKEASFTNSAAEASEGAAKAESALTWSLVNMPISTVAHWIKISRQLAADNVLLARYVDVRMRYGVNQKVELQIGTGNGTAPNISGIFDSGNFTAHGYANADLGSTFKKLVMIRKIMADLWAAGYPADAILLNPADWATIEIELLTTAAGQVRVSYNEAGQARLWGVPVVQSIGCAADTLAVGAFAQAYTLYNREGVVVEMSDSDSDNFTKNLITLRAERRLALATERPAACRAGDLTPA
jgi:HK97 family phage major capsid protein